MNCERYRVNWDLTVHRDVPKYLKGAWSKTGSWQRREAGAGHPGGKVRENIWEMRVENLVSCGTWSAVKWYWGLGKVKCIPDGMMRCKLLISQGGTTLMHSLSLRIPWGLGEEGLLTSISGCSFGGPLWGRFLSFWPHWSIVCSLGLFV